MLTPDVTKTESILEENRIVRDLEEDDFKGLLDAAYNIKQGSNCKLDQQLVLTRNLSQQAQNILKSEVDRARFDDLDQPLARDIPQSNRAASRRLGKSASHEGYRTAAHMNPSFDVPVDHTISLPLGSQVYLSPNNDVPKVEQMIRQQHHINKTSTITNKNASLPDATINGRPEGYRKEGGFAEGFSKGWQLTKASDQRSNEVKIDMDLPYIDDVTDRESPTRKPKVRSGCGSFGSKYPDFGSESKESLEAPNIVRTPHNFAVIRPELHSTGNAVSDFSSYGKLNGESMSHLPRNYPLDHNVRNVYPANSEMELKELPACTVPHEDSDNDCMQVDEKKKKINGRKKDKKTYSENTISTVGGRNEHLNQPLTVSLAPGYTRYGRGSPDAKQMLSGPGITYGSSPQRKSRNRRRSDVTQKIDHTKIDGYRGDEPVDKLLEYIEGSQISIKDVKRQKKKVTSNSHKSSASEKKHSSVGDAEECSDSDSPARKTFSVSGEIARDLFSGLISLGDDLQRNPVVSPLTPDSTGKNFNDKENSPVSHKKSTESESGDIDDSNQNFDGKGKLVSLGGAKSPRNDQQPKSAGKKSKRIAKSKSDNELESSKRLFTVLANHPKVDASQNHQEDKLDVNKNEISTNSSTKVIDFSCDMNATAKRLEPLVVDTTSDVSTKFFLEFDVESVSMNTSVLNEETISSILPTTDDQFIPVTGRRQKKHFRSYKGSDSFDKVAKLSVKRSVTPPPRDSPQWDEGNAKGTDMSGLRRRRKSADYTPMLNSPANCYRAGGSTDFNMLKSPNLATDVSEPPESDTHTEDGNLSVGSHTGNSQKPSYAAMARTSRPRPHSPALADFVAPVVSGTTQRKAPLSGGGGAHVSRHVGVRNDSSAVENSAWGPTHGRNANSLNPSRSNSPNSSANVSSINSAVASSPDLKVFSMNSATDFPPPLPLLAMVGSSPVKNSLSDVYMKEKISNPSPVGPVDPLETAEGVFTAPVQIISRLPPSGKTYATAATEKRPTAVVKPMTFEREPNPPVSPPKHGLINNLVVVATADVQVGGNGSGGGDESFHSTALNLSSQFNRVELGSVIYNNAKTTRGMSAEPFNNPNSTRSNKGKAVIPASGGNGGRPRAASMDNQSGAGVITAGGKPGKTTDVTSVKPPLNLAPMQSETNFSVSIPDGTGLAPPVTQRDNNSAAFLGIQGVPVVSCTRESGVNDAAKGPPAPTSTNPPERKPVPNAVETEPKRERKAASVSGATTKAVEFLNEPAGAYPAKTAAFEGLTFGFDLDEGSPSRDKKSAETERSAESSQTSPSQSATLSSENCSNVTAAGRGAATECGSDHPRCDPAVLVCGSAMPKSQWDRTTATQEVRGAVVKSRSFAGHDSNAVARENNEVMLKSMVKFVEQAWNEFTKKEDSVHYYKNPEKKD